MLVVPQTEKKYTVFGLGNPLLDIQSRSPELLEKYGLGANDAILAEDKHLGIYSEIKTKPDVYFVAGGAAQNAMRGASYLLPAESTVYVGCVGNDDLAQQLRACNEKESLRSEYKVDESTPTGACAVVLSGAHRSLCTNLGAANNYTLDHLKSDKIWALVENAEFYYVESYHLTVCVPAIEALGDHAAKTNKVFIMNLSAPFLAQFFKDQMDTVAPYWDYLIGNESEALAYAESHQLGTTDLVEIAKAIAALPKANTTRARTVIITQGADKTIVVKDGAVNTYPVLAISNDEILDTNGAGDAFAGGFLGALAAGKSIDTCVKTGQWLARESLKLNGPSYPYPKKDVPTDL